MQICNEIDMLSQIINIMRMLYTIYWDVTVMFLTITYLQLGAMVIYYLSGKIYYACLFE